MQKKGTKHLITNKVLTIKFFLYFCTIVFVTTMTLYLSYVCLYWFYVNVCVVDTIVLQIFYYQLLFANFYIRLIKTKNNAILIMSNIDCFVLKKSGAFLFLEFYRLKILNI